MNSLGFASISKIDYWETQRKGANFFNQNPSSEWFTDAKRIGIQFARLAPDKWKCEERDFLIGNADKFTSINEQDFKMLKSVLDDALSNDVKIVVTLLSLPGSRWAQNNQAEDDLRIWKEEKYRQQAIEFWTSLAELLKDHQAVVGYNILNEPHPEKLFGHEDFSQIDFQKWHSSIKETLADLNLFYRDLVEAIRQVDRATPIILDTGMYATPWAISYLTPIEDEKVLYSFHMYEPYSYTTRKINKGRFSYPGIIPISIGNSETNLPPVPNFFNWEYETLNLFLKPIVEWQEKHQIPSRQILVGEFGCDRASKGAQNYLSDLIQIFDNYGWHWAFYSFREDCWDRMDYELGTCNLPIEYWEAAERNASLGPFRHDNALFDVIKDKLN
ncbi:glycoside hydrolase family 5 protein [Simkania sp.]|uniref:glycoside hydrolase family 5 protein n=1 Tax=Simkania sp. TaxID=34094 RepID=UPI003B5260D9